MAKARLKRLAKGEPAFFRWLGAIEVGPGSTEDDVRAARNDERSMVIPENTMTISVTDLKARLLEIVREVERTGESVEVERHGRVVARIVPATEKRVRPWEALHGSGKLLADPEESVWFEYPGRKGKGKR
ncbi:MAG: type II toxin-antitoxin system Phd/YefM family antitoxin [Thermoanaerobaculia bacterium]